MLLLLMKCFLMFIVCSGLFVFVGVLDVCVDFGVCMMCVCCLCVCVGCCCVVLCCFVLCGLE